MQAANLQVLHLDMWDIPELPRMLNLKHLVLSMGNRSGTESNSSDLVWTCLNYLTELETLDLALVSLVEDKVRPNLLHACRTCPRAVKRGGRSLPCNLFRQPHTPACNNS